MKYLITGGSGYIGSRLTDLLVQHGDNEVVNSTSARRPCPDRAPASCAWTSATAASRP